MTPGSTPFAFHRMHKADPFGDEHHGMWFLYTKGSGVWYRIGNHISFPEHSDAYDHFGVSSNEEMSKAAAKADFDSVIFLAHRVSLAHQFRNHAHESGPCPRRGPVRGCASLCEQDHTNYPCDDAGNYPYMNGSLPVEPRTLLRR